MSRLSGIENLAEIGIEKWDNASIKILEQSVVESSTSRKLKTCLDDIKEKPG